MKIDKESQLGPLLKFQNPPNVLLNLTKLTLVKINYPKPLPSFTILKYVKSILAILAPLQIIEMSL